MAFADCREKFFVVVEGDDRAIIRSTYREAAKKRKQLAKFSGGKRIFIFRAKEKE